MDILFLLIPISVLLALAVMAVLAWAVWSGQFEDTESEAQRILQEIGPAATPESSASTGA
jgi:cbb3-type cytochrome oxidase maturation protein